MFDTRPTLTFSQRKQQELREEIVDAAFAEFAERGYHDTGIADIARRLGIGHGTFYRYFENKHDILDQVVTRIVDRLLAALAVDNAPDAAVTLEDYRAQTKRIATAMTQIFRDDPRAARLLLREATSIDVDLTDRLMSVYVTLAAVAAGYLENGVRRGYLRPDLDIDATAQAVVGIMIAATMNVLRNPGDTDGQKRFGAAMFELLLSGIVATDAATLADGTIEEGAPA